ncbi:ATP-dependent DNA ligase [Streptomyces pseudovenezuelae]|uniref:ATP-dependent DNA ligase n=1 Tax=Streptomyces pseudovenezuelae TaxID=67350 RepID=UPI002E34DD5C|nr:ATP-dependent DNA ligase [Streptomyces pseudovenezuelae]
MRLAGTDTTAWPYQRRRAALKSVFAARRLTAPWTLCPSTTERLADSYLPSAQGWLKYKPSEAIVGAVTGPPTAPRSLLLGRYDTGGHLHYVGRTTTLATAAGRAIAPLLTPAAADHPWTGWSFSAGWGSRETLTVTLVEPALVVEVGVDVARDAAGRWRHPARWHRMRADLTGIEVPLFGERENSAGR